MKDLRTQLTGRLVTPEDPDWDQARQAWNLCVDQHPAAVVQAESPDDIATAVRFAADHGLAVSAQPRGHVPEPFMLLYAGMVAVPELAAPIRAGQDAVRAAMTPHATSRQQPNFTETSRPEDTYAPETLARLRRIKQQRDPANTIRGNRPIN